MTKLYESTDKMVSHPSHYALIPEKNVEVIDVIGAATKDMSGIFATDTGNIIKYACRWNKKGNPKQDIEKIIFYATHLLQQFEENWDKEESPIPRIEVYRWE